MSENFGKVKSKLGKQSALKENFINFPKQEFCTTILSIGAPFSGKTYVMLLVLREWLKMRMFEEKNVHLVLPAYRNEMTGSYKWILDEYPDVNIYEQYNDSIVKGILKQQKKNTDLIEKGKLKEMPRVFLAIDDATSEKGIFNSKELMELVVKNRHLHCHQWYLLHYDKGVIGPKIRSNMYYVFMYKVKDALLRECFKDYVQFDEFDDYKKDFKPWWCAEITPHPYGFMLIAGKDSYSSDGPDWFESEE